MQGAGRLPYLLSNRHLRGAGADPFPGSGSNLKLAALVCGQRRAGWGPRAAEMTGSVQLRQCAYRAVLQWR